MANERKTVHVCLQADIHAVVGGIAKESRWSVTKTAGILIEEALETRYPGWREAEQEVEGK